MLWEAGGMPEQPTRPEHPGREPIDLAVQKGLW